jgi:indole-3-glycerol phosphate synthase
LIAEMKRASPSRGEIRPGATVEEIVTAYEAAGARACSILTEHRYFGGSLDDLERARAAVELPLLRKDFIVDPYQLLEARAAGADAALLIVAGLGAERLRELMAAASELDLDVLVETHDESEVEIAVDAGAEIIGINNRDLHTLEVDLSTTFRLLADIPAGTVVVAESGIATHDDVRTLQDAGVDAVLVGEALMSADDPGRAIVDLMQGPRSASTE